MKESEIIDKLVGYTSSKQYSWCNIFIDYFTVDLKFTFPSVSSFSEGGTIQDTLESGDSIILIQFLIGVIVAEARTTFEKSMMCN